MNNNYQQSSRVLCTFVSHESFGQWLDISPKYFIFLKTFDSEFKLWFTDKTSKPLDIKQASL